MKTLLFVNVLLVIVAAGLFHLVDNMPVREKVAYEMCQSSRMYDTVSEETCGEVLDYYGLDFVCEEANKLETNHCKVEEIK